MGKCGSSLSHASLCEQSDRLCLAAEGVPLDLSHLALQEVLYLFCKHALTLMCPQPCPECAWTDILPHTHKASSGPRKLDQLVGEHPPQHLLQSLKMAGLTSPRSNRPLMTAPWKAGIMVLAKNSYRLWSHGGPENSSAGFCRSSALHVSVKFHLDETDPGL